MDAFNTNCLRVRWRITAVLITVDFVLRGFKVVLVTLPYILEYHRADAV